MEMVNYKFRIYPTEEQSKIMWSWIYICRQQYNSARLDRENHYNLYKKTLTKLLKTLVLPLITTAKKILLLCEKVRRNEVKKSSSQIKIVS